MSKRDGCQRAPICVWPHCDCLEPTQQTEREKAEMREIIAMYVDPCDVRPEHQAIVNAIQGNGGKCNG
jgi:hypothetical protein